jgi:hypothetical protein
MHATPPPSLDRRRRYTAASRWAEWRALATSAARSRGLAVEPLQSTHASRLSRLMSAGIGWPVIIRYELDDPRRDEAGFETALASAIARRDKRRGTKGRHNVTNCT